MLGGGRFLRELLRDEGADAFSSDFLCSTAFSAERVGDGDGVGLKEEVGVLLLVVVALELVREGGRRVL